jgi:hypothetical protein
VLNMKTFDVDKAWENMIREVHKLDRSSPLSQQEILAREVLFTAQILLNQYKPNQDSIENAVRLFAYQRTMTMYYQLREKLNNKPQN